MTSSRKRTVDVDALIAGLTAGDRRSVARLISLVEDGAPEASRILGEVFARTGQAATIGITGSPGAGKSTLVDALIEQIGPETSVGVIAVDPTSPFTGGALLGDRVRVRWRPNVFMRSMATRGHLGGLSLAAPEAMRVLEAAGYDVVVVETVGVGQSEVEVAQQADTTVVVLAPGMGDAIQAAKAGILEIADVFCVNKADKPGAGDTVRDLRQMLGMGSSRDHDWKPPVVQTSASSGEGVGDLWEAIQGHRAYLSEHGRLQARRRERLAAEVREIVAERLREGLGATWSSAAFQDLVDEVVERRIDPYAAADRVLRGLRPGGDGATTG